MRAAGLPAFRGRILGGALIVALLLPALAAQPMPSSNAPSAIKPPASPAPARLATARKSTSAANAEAAAANAASIVRLTQSNQDLLDLLKKQQAVLEDIQFDRRLQNRQISSLEDRLQEAMEQNSKLEAKVAALEAQAAVSPASPGTLPASPAAPAPTRIDAAPAADQPPPPPATYLPAPDSQGAPGTKSWQRLFTLSGTDGRTSDPFHIAGRQWRVLWHNQDRPGAAYVNTSALFINAFPKNDSVPQKICSKLGSGGDATELDGPGNFSLKVEASGGAWELAVEDFK